MHCWFILYTFLALPLVQHSLESHKSCAAVHHPEQGKRGNKNMLKNMLMGLKIFKLEGLWLFVEQNVLIFTL
jgi:hypothetical protein